MHLGGWGRWEITEGRKDMEDTEYMEDMEDTEEDIKIAEGKKERILIIVCNVVRTL